MVLLYASPSLRVALVLVVFFTAWSLAEKRLLCSAEYGSVWYEYEGPLYYLTASLSPCHFGTPILNVNYTIISMFNVKLYGYHVTLEYQNKQWFDVSAPLQSCEGFKVCNIIKGERLQDSFTAHLNSHSGADFPGEYKAHLKLIILDEFDRELTINFTLTINVLHKLKF